MKKAIGLAVLCLLPLAAAPGSGKKKPDAEQTPTLDEYVQQVHQRALRLPGASPGSVYVPNGKLADNVRDVRASQLYDLVTILVSDTTSAVSTGVTNTQRKSSVNASVTSLFGPKSATGALANLANAAGDQQLQGQGTTSRQSTLTTTMTAEVTDVLPNGNLVVLGRKEIMVNSEKQVITLRGIVRPDDLSPLNSIPSDRVARMEILVNGKGVVNDATKRPFFLYRLLLGLLPF
ncbi:MAG TPA: flagellar basal body L-ring protein FlgH [Bryobacteraceae bacterium]|nr:flagellar basal body L-ring protein FlgH [Bryobacteraceae bacterium]